MTAAIMDALAEYLGAIEVPGHTGLLEGEDGLYVVHFGAMDDRTIIALVERLGAVRRRHANRRVNAVLVAEHIEPRYWQILTVVSRAVPLVALEMQEMDGVLRFSLIKLR